MQYEALKLAGRAGRAEAMSLEGGCMSLEATAKNWGKPENVLVDQILKNELIAIRDDEGRFHLPVWQFTDSGELLPGLSAILAKLRESPGYSEVTPFRFLLEPHPRIGGAPLEALRRGEMTAVLQAADAEVR